MQVHTISSILLSFGLILFTKRLSLTRMFRLIFPLYLQKTHRNLLIDIVPKQINLALCNKLFMLQKASKMDKSTYLKEEEKKLCFGTGRADIYIYIYIILCIYKYMHNFVIRTLEK